MSVSKQSASKHAEYRSRAQRLITGSFNKEDIAHLFLFLREHSYGCKTVRDIGDMIAHADSRKKGVSFDHISDVVEVVAYQMSKIEAYPVTPVLDLNDAPGNLIAFLEANLRMTDEQIVRSETKMNKAKANQVLKKLKTGFEPQGNGRLAWTRSCITEAEVTLIKCLTSVLSAPVLYDGAKLFEETSFLLVKHGFIDETQKPLLMKKRPHILLYAVERMHLVEFPLQNSRKAVASAGWSSEEEGNLIQVFVHFECDWKETFAPIVFTLFSTDLSSDEWVSESIRTKDHCSLIVPIELSNVPQIRLLTS